MSKSSPTVQPYVPSPMAPAAIQSQSELAAEAMRKRAARMAGRASTILTNPIGDLGKAPGSVKTLLGT